MNSSGAGRFFPNECQICRSRRHLQRCECKMISYCSEKHRLEHLSIHKNFCKAVKEILEEKQLSHINEGFFSYTNTAWIRTTDNLFQLEEKLERRITPMEILMWARPRVCFICRESKEEFLNNCKNCSIVTFCINHKSNEIHSKNCATMNRYLEILNTADVLNIDLQFLPSTFPFVDEKRNGYLDCLTFTIINENNFESNCFHSRKSKIDFINFVDIISRLNSALQKVLHPFPSELTIQINLFDKEHVIKNKKFWEFLLHLNSQIIKLNVTIYGAHRTDNNSVNISLCKKCSMQKILNIRNLSFSDSKNYCMPNVLIHFTTNDDIDYEQINKWCKLNHPIILLIDSKFNEAPYALLLLHERFRIVHNGPINTLFNEKSDFQKENYFIILQPKGEKEFSNNQVNNSIAEKTELNLNQNVLYFRTKCDELQQKLNSSIEEVAKLKKRNADLEKLCSELKEKNNSIKKILQI